MIEYQTSSGIGYLVQDVSELPGVPYLIPRLAADFETSSGANDLDSLNPHTGHCHIIGLAYTLDGLTSWFVPREFLIAGARHGSKGWWDDMLRAVDRANGHWENSNVKYDAHVSKNDLRIEPCKQMRCTVVGGKLLDSDRLVRGYGLKELSRDWLGRDISEHGAKMAPYLHRCKDFGAVPLDIIGEYACVDALAAWATAGYIEQNIPEESREVWATEQKVTRVLYDMEQRGVHVNPVELLKETYRTLRRMCDLDETMECIAGRPVRAHVNADCYDVLCVQYGLPILAWTEPSERKDGTVGVPGPSFDADALELYLQHVDARQHVPLLQAIVEYRSLHTFHNLFLSKWEELRSPDGILRANFNQTVRTGRMSCGSPNLQQLNERAKRLIVPRPGHALISADWASIEFRFIAHYIENPRWIQALNSDPWTDPHEWVAKMTHIERRPAKTLNFQTAFGGGKKKMVAALSVNKDVVAAVVDEIKNSGLPPERIQAAIAEACRRRGEDAYMAYHAALPELKPTAKAAEQACKSRGYVRNHYGRRRHLPPEYAWHAFPNLNQSSAGDLLKERMVAVSESRSILNGLDILAVVHDSVLGEVPVEALAEIGDDDQTPDSALALVDIMNSPSRPLRVPIRTAVGWSEKSWADADKRQVKPR